jgi:MFS family permease
MIPGSTLSDIWGRKVCFIGGLIVYGTGATLAMFAQGLAQLLPGAVGDDAVETKPARRHLCRRVRPPLGQSDPDTAVGCATRRGCGRWT